MPIDYNFKSITCVPRSKQFVDIILSKTQRKTATVVHKCYPISRIRGFYSHKIKFTQQNFHDRMSKILTDFPRLDDLHPFHQDLLGIMYQRDHYKIALSDVSKVRNLCDNISRDTTRMIKHADSLYRCKLIKKSALGRMAKLVMGMDQTLKYLEEVRQHLSRLPSIDPNTRTLLITGFPNVGKSSLINTLTRAEVEVQPWAHTTRSLYVGHMDYRNIKWQVIDTPGLLDQPIAERSTHEMLSITALAHLKAAIVYMFDVSEQCGFNLESQLQLFENICPLFKNKPLFVMVNKTDVVAKEDLDAEKLKMFEELEAREGVELFWTSTVEGTGVMEMRQAACDKLLTQRVQEKLTGKRTAHIEANKNRIHVAMPVKRGDKERPLCIPAAVLAKRQRKAAGEEEMETEPLVTERMLELEQGDDYYLDLRKTWDMKQEWKHDVLPEIIDGHNIYDFMDPEIEAKLEQLEAEEGMREEGGFYDDNRGEVSEEMLEIRRVAEKIREKKELNKIESRLRRNVKKAKLPRNTKKEGLQPEDMVEGLAEYGIDLSEREGHFRSRSTNRKSAAKKRSASQMDTDESGKILARSGSSYRSMTRPRDQSGLRDASMQAKAKKMAKIAQRPMIRMGKQGESDRHIGDMKPKHLFTGKRGVGKTDRR